MNSSTRSKRSTSRIKLKADRNVSGCPVVVVRWMDAARDTDFDGQLSDVKAGMVRNYTVGFLVSQDKDCLILVQDASPDENTVRWQYSIPTAGVEKVQIIKRGWAR